MAGLSAPFGRDDQPDLEVKIIGGKQVQITIDKSSKEEVDTAHKQTENYGQAVQHYANMLGSSRARVPKEPSPPPWITREDTPPRKLRRALDTDRGSRDVGMPGSSSVLPPISNERGDNPSQGVRHKLTDSQLTENLSSLLAGFNTRSLKDAYLTFAGFDSTLSGFVAAEQVEQVFRKCHIPVTGSVLKVLIAKFMSAHRPNWVNYEQLLKFIDDSSKASVSRELAVPKLALTSHPQDTQVPHNSPRKNDIPLKPNQVSPRMEDGSETGRQSSIAVKQAFQDRQDAQLLILMEQMLKKAPNVRQNLTDLRRGLEEMDVVQAEYVSSQKVKTLCQRYRLPFNPSLLDKIMDRLDPRNSGKVSWPEFLSFVDRAMPLSSAGSSTSSRSLTTSGTSRETPPSRPVWETRQPLGSVRARNQVIPQEAAVEQGRMFEEQQRALNDRLEEQSREQRSVLQGRQRDLESRARSLSRKDHLAGDYERAGDWDQESDPGGQRQALEARHQELLRRQQRLIEQKRQVQREQEQLDRYIREQKHKLEQSGSPRAQPQGEGESRVECFARLAKALYLCDQERDAGLMVIDSARRLVTNYNLVYQLGFSMETIENTLRACSTTDDRVSIEHFIDGLKEQLTL